jgi:K+-transporting ATPase KdpF subunit
MPPSARASDKSKSDPMFDDLLGAAVSLAIFIYLVYALLRPEKF